MTKKYSSTSSVGKIEIEEGFVLPVLTQLQMGKKPGGIYVGPIGANDGIPRHIHNPLDLGIPEEKQHFVEVNKETHFDNKRGLASLNFTGVCVLDDIFAYTMKLIDRQVNISWLDLDLCLPVVDKTLKQLRLILNATSHIDVITLISSARYGLARSPWEADQIVEFIRRCGWNVHYTSYYGTGPMHLFVITRCTAPLTALVNTSGITEEELSYIELLNCGFPTVKAQEWLKDTKWYKCRQTLDKYKKRMYANNQAWWNALKSNQGGTTRNTSLGLDYGT